MNAGQFILHVQRLKCSTLLIGFYFRVILLYIGSIIDDLSHNGLMPPYTDIDYHVYSDAAKLMLQGNFRSFNNNKRYLALFHHLFRRIAICTDDVSISTSTRIIITSRAFNRRSLFWKVYIYSC